MTTHIIVISGPSLSGKSEFSNRLKEAGAVELVSLTTRPQRSHEIDGTHYQFVSKEEFKNLVDKNNIVQQSFLHNEYYGMSINEIINKSDLNKPLIWVIAPQSVPQIEQFIKNNHPDWKLTKCLIFNTPEVLAERLLTRFENDLSADKSHYATRFINLIGTEIPQWTSKETQDKYDFIVNNFSQDTEAQVIKNFLNIDSINKTHPDFCSEGLSNYSNSKKCKI